MAREIKHYECGVCTSTYDSLEEAEGCEAKGVVKPSVAVGDIILAGAGFGWYDGDKKWISNPNVKLRQKPCPNGDGNCFSDCCTYAFYYVVTAIDLDDDDHLRSQHRRRYHLFTKAMSGKGYRQGYTFDRYHAKPKKVDKPPAYVVRTSKVLIGKKARFLL